MNTRDIGAVSAYAIAVEHGYVGTETEWVESLRKNPKEAEAEARIKRLVQEGRKRILELNSNHRCLNFALITDTHMFRESDAFACENNVRLFAEVANYTDFAVHCGDVAESGNMSNAGDSGTYVDRYDNFDNLGRFLQLTENIRVPLYIAHGNHDVSRYTAEVPAENAIRTEAWWTQVAGRTGSGIRTNPNDPFGGYYYVDYPEFNCRVIVANHYNHIDDSGSPESKMGMNATEVRWLVDEAFNVADSNTTILIFNHCYQFNGIIGGDKFYRLPKTIHGLRWRETVESKANGNPVILVHGNDHQDDYLRTSYSKSASTQDYKDDVFNNIGVDNSFIKVWENETVKNGWDSAWNATGVPGTDSEYCVDIFTIDFTEGRIYETRLGRGKSREYSFGRLDSENYQIT